MTHGKHFNQKIILLHTEKLCWRLEEIQKKYVIIVREIYYRNEKNSTNRSELSM